MNPATHSTSVQKAEATAAAHSVGIHLVKQYNSLKGHTGPVNSVTVANNGMLLSGSDDKTIKLWDLDNEKRQDPVYSFDSEAGKVLSLTNLVHNAFASGHLDDAGAVKGTLMTWDIDSKNGSLLGKHDAGICALAYNPDKNLLFSGTSGQDKVKKWDLATRQGISFEHSSYVHSLVVVPPDVLLGSWGNISKWDLDGNLTVFGHSPAEANILALSPDAAQLVSGSSDGSVIKIWNSHTGDVVHKITGPNSHKGSITAFAFLSRDILVSASIDRSLRFWNPNSGEWLDTIENAHSKEITCLATRGNILISASSGDNCEIKLWKKTT